MREVKRNQYLERILPFVDSGFVKVLSGLRGAGKTTILTAIREGILKDIPKERKIYFNFEETEIKNYEDLYQKIKPILEEQKGKKCFFFDEIQNVEGWHKLINGLRLEEGCDIFVAGSTKKLLAGETSTYLTGRYVEIEIRCLTFKEYFNQARQETREEQFEEFIKKGGLPGVVDLHEEGKQQEVKKAYNEIIQKDIPSEMKDYAQGIMNLLMASEGKVLSAKEIRKVLKEEKKKLTEETLLEVLRHCEEAFMIKKAKLSEVNGKRLLNDGAKYYLADHGFRKSQSNSDRESVLKNIIFNEMIARGYSVEVGRIKKREIDFVAERDGNKKYIQVCYMLVDENVQQREFGAFDGIKDHYDKIVLSMDKFDFSQNGIKHYNIIDFLLDPSI